MESHPEQPPSTPPVVTLIHDITSLPSWLAILRILSLEPVLIAKVGFRGFEHIGVDMPIKADIQTKAVFLTMQPEFAHYDRNIRCPQYLVPTYKAHAIINWAWHEGFGLAMMVAMYEAFWEQSLDINQEATLVAIASQVTADPTHIQAVEAILSDRFNLNTLRMDMVQARASHIGGVPVLQVAGTLQPAVIEEAAYRDLLTML